MDNDRCVLADVALTIQNCVMLLWERRHPYYCDIVWLQVVSQAK